MKIVTVLLNPAIDRVIEVPHLTLGKHLQGRLKVRYPAGKAVNVSRCLAVLGHSSLATGFVGKAEVDFYRDYVRCHHGDLVECRFVLVDGQTRENITLIDSRANLETHIRDAGFSVTPEDVNHLSKVLEERVNDESIVCFSGSLPPAMGHDTFLRLVDDCLQTQAKVVIDSNGPHMKEIVAKAIWLVKPNLAELEEISSRKLDSDIAIYQAARVLNQHFELVLVSAGKSGAYLVTGEDSWKGYLLLSAKEIINTVGCGDCLLAGFLAGCAAGFSRDEALRSAVAAASASALSETPAQFQHSVFMRLRQQVRILPWNPS